MNSALCPLPREQFPRRAIIGGSALAIPENAKNKDLAEEFVKWFFEEGNFKNYLQDDKGLSALKNVVYEPSEEGAAAD